MIERLHAFRRGAHDFFSRPSAAIISDLCMIETEGQEIFLLRSRLAVRKEEGFSLFEMIFSGLPSITKEGKLFLDQKDVRLILTDSYLALPQIRKAIEERNGFFEDVAKDFLPENIAVIRPKDLDPYFLHNCIVRTKNGDFVRRMKAPNASPPDFTIT